MTEAEWLATDNVAAMLEYLSPASPASDPWKHSERPASPRKLRLFACACCRLVWPQLTDPRSRRAVEVAERFADGLATSEELDHAWYESTNAVVGLCKALRFSTVDSFHFNLFLFNHLATHAGQRICLFLILPKLTNFQPSFSQPVPPCFVPPSAFRRLQVWHFRT